MLHIEIQRLQNCKTAKLQNCKTAKLQNCKTARLQDCKTARQQDCKTARQQDCKTARQQDCYYGSNINISSMVTPKTPAISCASLSDGLYLFFSRKTMVSRRTFTFLARSSWVRSNRARYSRIRLFIFNSSEIDN